MTEEFGWTERKGREAGVHNNGMNMVGDERWLDMSGRRNVFNRMLRNCL